MPRTNNRGFSAVTVLATSLGFSIALVNISAQTTLQAKTPLEIRGRVFAVQFLVANVAGLPSTLFIGTLADRIGIPRVILLIAGVGSDRWTRRLLRAHQTKSARIAR